MTLKHVEMMFLVLIPSNRFWTTVLQFPSLENLATGRPENAMLREHEFDTLAATVVWIPGCEWFCWLAKDGQKDFLMLYTYITVYVYIYIYIYIYICMILLLKLAATPAEIQTTSQIQRTPQIDFPRSH